MKRFLPESLFARLLLSFLGISIGFILFSNYLFYLRTYRVLDEEAGHQLLQGAQSLAVELKNLAGLEGMESSQAFFRKRFDSWPTTGWIQNAYWVDFQGKKPRFLSLFSTPASASASLQPPTIEDVEDLIDQGILKLEDGKPIFPDPYAMGDNRHLKIVMVPVLDEDGLLESVIGLEADMRYLDLHNAARENLRDVLVLALTVCFIVSTLLARSFTRKIETLLADLHQVENQLPPSPGTTGIRELDVLKNGLVQLEKIIYERNQRIQSFYEEKLQELSFTGAAIAHEVRNPLSAMEIHLGLIRRKYSPERSADLEPFNDIAEQMARMKSLVENFLQYSRKVNPQRSKFSVLELVREVLSLKKSSRGSFESDLFVPGDLLISFDPAMFRQIFENLVDNAIDARPSGLVLTCRASGDQGMVGLELTDNGPGIPADLVPRLFTPFASGKTSGHGIGLALVKKLIEAHKGMIRFHNRDKGGACFLIEVPDEP